MKIVDVMTREVLTCGSSDTLNRPAQLMWEGDVGWIPVLDATARVIGIVTDRDIAMAAYLQGRPLTTIPVQAVMTRRLATCKPGDDPSVALRQMQTQQVRRLPVVDGTGKLVGVIALNDIARRSAAEPGKSAVREHELAAALVGICEPRSTAKAPPSSTTSPKATKQVGHEA